MIKGIIFDLDGVLVDAVEWHFDALNRALKIFGFNLSETEHQSTYNGLPTQTKLEMLSKAKSLPRGLHSFISNTKQKYTLDIINQYCKANSDLTHLLATLKERGYLLAVASNSVKETVEQCLNKMEIAPYFDIVLSRQDVKRSKPYPDIFFRCLELMNLNSSEVAIIEDSKPGIEAARQTTSNVITVSSAKELKLSVLEEKLLNLEQHNPTTSNQEKKSAPLIQVVIPMAGLGTRFQSAGYVHPKPFIDVMGKPMIQWVKENLTPQTHKSAFLFLVNESHLKNPSYRRQLDMIAPQASYIPIHQTTEGAACTVLLSLDKLNPAQPLVIANSDQWVDINIDDFINDAIQSNCDGSIMCFPATDKKWSYAKTNRQGRVVEVAEKNPISENATVGIYYFKKAQDFINGALAMIAQDIRTNGEFYVCPVYNELIKKRKRIQCYHIEAGSMHGLGTPEDLKIFLSWQKNATLPECTAENVSPPSLPVTTNKPKSPLL